MYVAAKVVLLRLHNPVMFTPLVLAWNNCQARLVAVLVFNPRVWNPKLWLSRLI